MKFIKEFVKNPKNVGAIAPSGAQLAEKMIETIDFKNSKCIVEYGPGLGSFTEKLLSRISDDTIFIALEVNEEFYKILKKKYGHRNNVKIINDGAQNLDKYLKKFGVNKVDYIVSGLAFTSLDKEISSVILEKTKNIVNKDGAKFITFQYSLVKIGLFKQYFNDIDKDRVIANIPPAYVLRCS
ncbi:class I SAM-dependent methyltransferase [Clostridium massiliamazoniense]|uniref:class I SAM-dependent methyltransferase n=1 Tax=Clostridium massiliamazoniense TaxID=1347366 RepID=UPI0006D7D7A4|nr:rRNA adenine N-6-methyltransferase family protein [Clostridium massiliamazoniense]